MQTEVDEHNSRNSVVSCSAGGAAPREITR
jgi:hypothetical protein